MTGGGQGARARGVLCPKAFQDSQTVGLIVHATSEENESLL